MNLNPLPMRRQRGTVRVPRPSSLERRRITLPDGVHTTLHVAAFHRRAFTTRVALIEPPMELVRWCRQREVRHAVVGGFFARPEYVPLGELHIGGEARRSVPFEAPWGDVRACVEIVGGELRIASRDQLDPHSSGDRLQAGPLLVSEGRAVVADGGDREGFSAGARQFDSDITAGRYPRAALAIAGDRLLAVACDGRTRRDAGMTLGELADAVVELGASAALNLDGGGSASLVYDGQLRNRPREQHGVDLLDGRPVVTAVVFDAS
jgi:hypothetical protein